MPTPRCRSTTRIVFLVRTSVSPPTVPRYAHATQTYSAVFGSCLPDFRHSDLLVAKDDTPCRTVSIVIADSAQATLITRDAGGEKCYTNRGHYPVGQSMKDINLLDLEQQIKKNPYISEVLCVKTPGNCVRIHVSQRLPPLRIMNGKGERLLCRQQRSDAC